MARVRGGSGTRRSPSATWRPSRGGCPGAGEARQASPQSSASGRLAHDRRSAAPPGRRSTNGPTVASVPVQDQRTCLPTHASRQARMWLDRAPVTPGRVITSW
jgi:hypothetical protein